MSFYTIISYFTRKSTWEHTSKFSKQKTVSFSIRSNAMAGAVRLELTTYGFGDRCSTSWAIPLWGDLWGSNPCVLEPQSSVLTASPKPPYKFYKETREPRVIHESLCGNYLLSHVVSNEVPSAFERLTTVFGMGTGGTVQASSPHADLFQEQSP